MSVKPVKARCGKSEREDEMAMKRSATSLTPFDVQGVGGYSAAGS